MALHPEFPKSPYAELLPEQRWFPAAEELRSTAYEKLLPPLVAKIRDEIAKWRADGYAGASDTSRALLNWWFETDHLTEQADGTIWIAETKGREERDLPQKMTRLRQWCEDATSASRDEDGAVYRFVYVDQQSYERNSPKTFAGLATSFTEFQASSTK